MTNKIKNAIIGISLAAILIIAIIVFFIILYFTSLITFVIVIFLGYLINWIFLIDVLYKQRTDLRSRVSWILLLLLLPLCGSIIYYWGGFVPLKKRNQLEEIGQNLIENGEIIYSNEERLKIDELFLYNISFQNQKVLSDTNIEIVENGNNKFPLLIDLLKKAKKTINIQYFIINDGIIWRQIEEILIEKLSNGISVRIITDYIGNLQTNDSIFDNIKKNGAEVFVFNKAKYFFKNGYSNFRNHNKFVIIDNELVLFGGMNIGDDYAGLYGKYGTWYDLQFLLKGEVVKKIEDYYVNQWNLFTNNNGKINTNYSYKEMKGESNISKSQIFFDGPDFNDTHFLNNFLNLINNSKNKIMIVSPYLILPKSILDAFSSAIHRGVEIEIITIGIPDKKSAYFIGGVFIEDLIRRGVKVYKTNKIFTHSKFFLFDEDEILFGTTNLDYRAMFLHFETNIIVKDNSFNNELSKVFYKYKNNSYQVISKQNTLLFKLKYFLLKIISPMF